MRKKLSLLNFTVFCLLVLGLTCFAQSDNNSSNNSNKQENLKDHSVKVISKPKIKFPKTCPDKSVTVVLRLIFDRSSKITNIRIVKPSTCEDFDKMCVNVAGKIKFKPAVKNGETITVSKEVTFIGDRD